MEIRGETSHQTQPLRGPGSFFHGGIFHGAQQVCELTQDWRSFIDQSKGSLTIRAPWQQRAAQDQPQIDPGCKWRLEDGIPLSGSMFIW